MPVAVGGVVHDDDKPVLGASFVAVPLGGTPLICALKINEKKILGITKSIEKKMEAVLTAVWDYKELVDVMQQEIRQTRQKNRWSRKRKPRKW